MEVECCTKLCNWRWRLYFRTEGNRLVLSDMTFLAISTWLLPCGRRNTVAGRVLFLCGRDVGEDHGGGVGESRQRRSSPPGGQRCLGGAGAVPASCRWEGPGGQRCLGSARCLQCREEAAGAAVDRGGARGRPERCRQPRPLRPGSLARSLAGSAAGRSASVPAVRSRAAARRRGRRQRPGPATASGSRSRSWSQSRSGKNVTGPQPEP